MSRMTKAESDAEAREMLELYQKILPSTLVEYIARASIADVDLRFSFDENTKEVVINFSVVHGKGDDRWEEEAAISTHSTDSFDLHRVEVMVTAKEAEIREEARVQALRDSATRKIRETLTDEERKVMGY